MESLSKNIDQGGNEIVEDIIDLYELIEVTNEFEVEISNKNTNIKISESSSQNAGYTELNNFSTKYANSDSLNKSSSQSTGYTELLYEVRKFGFTE